MIGLVLKISWAVVMVWSATHQSHAWDDFDVRRCYALHQQVYCWPKRGVFMAGDRAMAWQVVTVKQK